MRFLDKHVLARFDRRFGVHRMELRGAGDHDGVARVDDFLVAVESDEAMIVVDHAPVRRAVASTPCGCARRDRQTSRTWLPA